MDVYHFSVSVCALYQIQIEVMKWKKTLYFKNHLDWRQKENEKKKGFYAHLQLIHSIAVRTHSNFSLSFSQFRLICIHPRHAIIIYWVGTWNSIDVQCGRSQCPRAQYHIARCIHTDTKRMENNISVDRLSIKCNFSTTSHSYLLNGSR